MFNWQDYAVVNVRTAAILTTSYVAGTIIGAKNATLNSPSPTDVCLEGYNQCSLLVDFTIGSLTSLEVMVEYGIDDGVGGYLWYEDTFLSYSTKTGSASLGTYQMTDAGKYIISVPIKARYIRVSAKGTGTTTNSTCNIKAIIGTV